LITGCAGRPDHETCPGRRGCAAAACACRHPWSGRWPWRRRSGRAQADRPVPAGRPESPRPAESRRPLDLFERAQAGLGTIHVADGHAEVNACSEGGRKLHQRLMQCLQGDAVGALGSRPFAVHRLNGRFQLEPSDGLEPVGAAEQGLALGQQRGIPAGGILVIEGGRLPGRREAGGCPGQGEGEQRSEPERLGVPRQERSEGRGEVERFSGERVDLAGTGRLPMELAPYTASSTAGSRAGRSARWGTESGIRASRIRRLARTRRCARVAGGRWNTVAMWAVSMPSTVCSMSGVRMPGSIAGSAQTESSSRRFSPIRSTSMSFSPPANASVSSSLSPRGIWRRTAADFHRSRRRLRATVTSQPSGLSGMPARGHVVRARSNASARASSAAGMSPVGAESTASRRP